MPSPQFLLNVLSPKGGVSLRSFSDLPGGVGLKDGLAASSDPYGGCLELLFSARSDLAQLLGGEVLEAFINDGGLKPVFYGAVVVGHPSDQTEQAQSYTANARALLLASACRGDRYRNQDTAAIALDLVNKRRHPALKVRAADFPASGTVLPAFTALGPLGEVLDELLELTENKSYGAGLDPTGFVFFRPNTQTREVDYEDSDYATLPLSGSALTTAVLWSLTAELSDYAGPYVPGVLTHLSVPDAALHERYGYERSRDVPLSAFAAVPDNDFTQVGFSSPGNAVSATATTPAVRTGTGTSTFTLPINDPLIYGVRLAYKLGDDAGTVKFRATSGSTYFERELQKSDTDFKPIDLILPPHDGPFAGWSSFKITAAAGGVFELLNFFPLRLDTNRLDATAPPIVPERRPGQVAQKGIKTNAATIVMQNTPRGRLEQPSASLRWLWTPQAGAETVTDLETSAYAVDDPALEKVSGYYRRK